VALPSTDKDLANLALANLGHTTQVADLANDNTTEAKNARLFLDSEREVCLAEYDWRWARKQAVLVEATGTGDWWDGVEDDWAHVYAPPPDCLQPRQLYSGTRNPRPDQVEPFAWLRNAADNGFVIACDVAPVTTGSNKAPLLWYTKRATTVTEYPQPFVKFFVWALAVHLAVPVIGGEEGREARRDAQLHRRSAFLEAARFDFLSARSDPAPTTPSIAARRGRGR
jgi:hypothetical protein